MNKPQISIIAHTARSCRIFFVCKDGNKTRYCPVPHVLTLDLIRAVSVERRHGIQLRLSHLSLASTPPPPNRENAVAGGAFWWLAGGWAPFFCSSRGSLPPIHPTLCLTLAELGFCARFEPTDGPSKKEKFASLSRRQGNKDKLLLFAYAPTHPPAHSLGWPSSTPQDHVPLSETYKKKAADP